MSALEPILSTTVESLTKLVETQSRQIEEQSSQINRLTAQIAWLNRQLFGRRSERFIPGSDQPGIFSEVDFGEKKPETEEFQKNASHEVEVKGHRRRQISRNRESWDNLPVLVIDTIEPKDIDLSRYRQIKQFAHLGMEGIKEATMTGWFRRTMELLRPLYEALKAEVMASDYIQADETTVPVINNERHQADKEYLWMVRSVMEGLVVFFYDKGSRVAKVIKNFTDMASMDTYSVTATPPTLRPTVRARMCDL